jgi:cystathionine beta-lyase/cystathionine gamma-synthase
VQGGVEAGITLMDTVELWTLAENLGAVESLITHPVTMTHAAIPREERIAAGITDGLVRLSVGLEDAEDLIAALDAALTQL